MLSPPSAPPAAEADIALEELELDPKTGLPILRHRGPDSKAKPRKKLLDLQNEIETINRKLINVDISSKPQYSPDGGIFLPADADALRYLVLLRDNLGLTSEFIDDVPDKTKKVLELNILSRLKEFILYGSASLQYETCWILTNIAAGPSTDTKAVVDAQMIEPLIMLLRSPISQVQVQAAWTLGNIAGDNKAFSQMLLDQGIMEPLLEIISRPKHVYRKDLPGLHVVCWVIANLCRWEDKDWNQLKKSFAFLTETLLYVQEEDVLSECCWALSRIFHGKDDCILPLVSREVCFQLIKLLRSVKPSLQNPVLRAMTNISGDSNPAHTDILLQSGILEAIQYILRHRHNYANAVVAEVLHCLSNITAGTTQQKGVVSEAGLFVQVREILEEGDIKAKREACHVLRNAVDRDATPEHFRDVVGPNGEIFKPMTTLVANSYDDPETLRQAVETLNIIFSRGNEPLIKALYPFANPDTNVYVTCMNILDRTNFANLWSAYQKSKVTGDDLTPLLFKFTLKEQEKQETITVRKRGGLFGNPDIKYPDLKINMASSEPMPSIESEMAKPGFSATSFVAVQRLRKRISDDLSLMMETYLKDQVKELMDEENLIDGIVSSVHKIGFAA
ncbi:Importin alpha subunit (Karyopherin alpha subunit) (Serine-rich RNA polymerase I suppressor protein) [Phlyctochytrium planicorne]|nr:Importin alpha subunit (Karyopherin alpha subunit) (Serine-rich RNA polymerase I suppressor protein) [Phlyctochytrium planicorne]